MSAEIMGAEVMGAEMAVTSVAVTSVAEVEVRLVAAEVRGFHLQWILGACHRQHTYCLKLRMMTANPSSSVNVSMAGAKSPVTTTETASGDRTTSYGAAVLGLTAPT